MARTWNQIAQMVYSMMKDQEHAVTMMREVNLRYTGDYVVPFPDLDDEPKLPPLTPMLVGEAIDQLGMRAAQVVPNNHFPALEADKDTGVRSREFARKRHGAVHASYKASMWDLQRPRSFRQLVAYNTTSLVVLPDFKRKMPLLQVRDPLSTFAEKVDPSTPRPPEYVAYVTRHSGESLRRRYPALQSERGGPISRNHTEYEWEVAEWIDTDQIIYGLLGPVFSQGDHIDQRWVREPWMPIAGPFPNVANIPLAIVPRQVTLAGVASRIGNMLGMIDLQAKLQGLEIQAQEKAIYPDLYAIGTPTGSPEIVGGAWKDGTSGEFNMLRDVDSIGALRTDVSPMTTGTIDRMERNFRVSTGLSPFFGGETFNSLRTGRAIDAMTNLNVDPRIMELHLIAEQWMPYCNQAILQTYKEMWPSKKYEVFTGLEGDLATVTFTPSQHIETLDNTTDYPFPGADLVQQTQILGSLLGTKSISRKRFRELHPWIGDPDGERELVQSEEMEEALMAAVTQQIQQGALPLDILASIHRKVKTGKSIFEAIEDAQREAQERQATEAPPPEPGQVAAPETQPGLAAPPEQQVQPPAAERIQVPPDAQRMRQLMQTMRA